MQSCNYATDTNANTDADTVFGNQLLMSADVRCRQWPALLAYTKPLGPQVLTLARKKALLYCAC